MIPIKTIERIINGLKLISEMSNMNNPWSTAVEMKAIASKLLTDLPDSYLESISMNDCAQCKSLEQVVELKEKHIVELTTKLKASEKEIDLRNQQHIRDYFDQIESEEH